MRRRLRAMLAIAASLTLSGLAIWTGYIEPRSLVIHEATLQLPRWPETLSGLRVAAISDLHVGNPYMTVARLRMIVARTNALAPDLVVLLGDFVTSERMPGFVAPEQIAVELGALHAPLGVFAVLGNHESYANGERMQAALETARIVVLDQNCAVLPRKTPLLLVGVADSLTKHGDLRSALRSCGDELAPVVVLTHNPDLFPDVPSRVSLTLAGHTHGGQILLPLVGALVVPSHYGQRYRAGHIVEGGRHLFVTTGAGSAELPLRLGVPPEIALLTLTSQTRSSSAGGGTHPPNARSSSSATAMPK